MFRECNLVSRKRHGWHPNSFFFIKIEIFSSKLLAELALYFVRNIPGFCFWVNIYYQRDDTRVTVIVQLGLAGRRAGMITTPLPTTQTSTRHNGLTNKSETCPITQISGSILIRRVGMVSGGKFKPRGMFVHADAFVYTNRTRQRWKSSNALTGSGTIGSRLRVKITENET